MAHLLDALAPCPLHHSVVPLGRRGASERGREQTPRSIPQPGLPSLADVDLCDTLGSLAFRPVMTRIMVMPETMSLAAVKARFSELVDRVERQQDRVVVTRNGKPAAVLISADDLESLEETLAVMSDRSLAAQIRESRQAIAAGEPGSDLDELRTSLEQRRSDRK